MLGTADSVPASAPASDDADLDLLAILVSPEESDANLLGSGTAPHSPWSGEWLQDTDLWDPVPSCPLECQNDVSAELLVSLCSEPANSHLPEDASHEEAQLQSQEPMPVAVDNLLRVPPKTSSDSPPRRQRATPLTSSRDIQRRHRDRQRVSCSSRCIAVLFH